jgi:hypothetical protein
MNEAVFTATSMKWIEDLVSSSVSFPGNTSVFAAIHFGFEMVRELTEPNRITKALILPRHTRTNDLRPKQNLVSQQLQKRAARQLRPCRH